MKALLTGTAVALGLSLTAANAVDYFDPANFHVGATSDGGPGTDPNLIPSGSKFFIADIPNVAIDNPLSIFFAVPTGSPAPSVSGVFYESQPLPVISVSAVANLGAYTGATDLYTAIGCIACDNSLNFANISAAEAPLFGGVAPTSYTLYGVVAGTSFNGQDFVEVDGAFGLGTVVFPLAQNNKFDKDGQLKSITYYDTSWTNAGLITNDVVINPTGGGAPEPSTWLMGLIGFGLVGFLGLRRNRMSVA